MKRRLSHFATSVALIASSAMRRRQARVGKITRPFTVFLRAAINKLAR